MKGRDLQFKLEQGQSWKVRKEDCPPPSTYLPPLLLLSDLWWPRSVYRDQPTQVVISRVSSSEIE